MWPVSRTEPPIARARQRVPLDLKQTPITPARPPQFNGRIRMFRQATSKGPVPLRTP